MWLTLMLSAGAAELPSLSDADLAPRLVPERAGATELPLVQGPPSLAPMRAAHVGAATSAAVGVFGGGTLLYLALRGRDDALATAGGLVLGSGAVLASGLSLAGAAHARAIGARPGMALGLLGGLAGGVGVVSTLTGSGPAFGLGLLASTAGALLSVAQCGVNADAVRGLRQGSAVAVHLRPRGQGVELALQGRF